MRHEALPHAEHVQVNERFWRVIIPMINFLAFRAMNTMLEQGTLRQQSATRLLQDLWAEQSTFYDDTQRAWRATPPAN